MADLLFLKRGDGQIIKLEGDNAIHAYVDITRLADGQIQTVGDVYNRLSLIEHDSCVRDRIMARLFLLPNSRRTFDRLSQTSDENFAIVIKYLKDSLSYLLFPVAMEMERIMERRYGSRGALMRSLGNVPVDTQDTFSYFQREWFVE